ncbi:MAG: hypothetical protein MZW92_62550 [Comamonadaceae bacterium]|nr:hypothetical protein [Comamonadaceae bacterium]
MTLHEPTLFVLLLGYACARPAAGDGQPRALRRRGAAAMGLGQQPDAGGRLPVPAGRRGGPAPGLGGRQQRTDRARRVRVRRRAPAFRRRSAARRDGW